MASSLTTRSERRNNADTTVDLLMRNLARFYSRKSNMDVLLAYVDSKSAPVSLRTIDFFVTKYSQTRAIVLKASDPGDLNISNVYLSYKAQLKAFHKKLFDPFRRHEKIMFRFDESVSVTTTVAQLNFFRWLIEGDLLSYILEHKDEIQAEMDAYDGRSGGGHHHEDAQQQHHDHHRPAPPSSATPTLTNITRGWRIVRFQ